MPSLEKPSFVFIITDTQGINVLGTYTGLPLGTPNLDALAGEGIKFERAYTTCPVCTPARAAIFTGVYAHEAGAWTNNLPLGANMKTMGQRFRDGGYRTAYIGKWHLSGHDYFDTGICPDGWDEEYWYDGRRYLEELNKEEIALWRSGLQTVEALRRHDIKPEFTWAHRVSDRAIGFLERHGDEPFLLTVSYDEPHGPSVCPPEYAERFAGFRYPVGPGGRDDLRDKPAQQREWAAGRAHGGYNSDYYQEPLYFGCNSFVDAEIGRVIQAAEEFARGNTYIVFTSDHGNLMHQHGLHGKGPVMYEEITHIPLIVKPPRGAVGGVSLPALASHADLLPTLLELAGLDIPPLLQGRSLVPLIRGEEDGARREVVIEFNRYEIEHDSWGGFQPIRCIIHGGCKLAVNLLDTDELYDLERDPAETRNLIGHPEYADVRDELHDKLLAWMYAKRDPFRGPCWERRPWKSNRRLAWKGSFRPRPDDGYAPSVLDYDTGLPAGG